MILSGVTPCIHGLCQSRLSTADHALLLIAPATTAVCRISYKSLAPTTPENAAPLLLRDVTVGVTT
jgi:hypothetical protein